METLISKKGNKKFAVVVMFIQIIFIVIFAFFVEYDKDAVPTYGKLNETIEDASEDAKDGTLVTYYPMFQDIHAMIFFGVGFLYTFLKKYGYSGVGMTMLLACISIQLSIITQNMWNMSDGKIQISIVSLIMGEFAAASAVIALGGVFGKMSPLQMVIFAAIEVAVYTINEHICVSCFQVVDLGGSVSLHLFAGLFGLAVAYVADRDVQVQGNSNEDTSYNSNLFCMIGTIFLWAFWPSFNSALAVGESRHRSAINTYLALLASCMTSFAISSFLNKEGKFTASHIQNSTLAGGVAIGAITNLMVQPMGALIVGGLAGCISVMGFKYVSPWLATIRVYDPCGINSLHAIPGLFSGLSSIVVALLATENNYGYSLYKLYPAMAPEANTTALFDLQKNLVDVEAGEGRTPLIQAAFQLLYTVICMIVSITTGLITGSILRCQAFDPLEDKQMYLDEVFWDVPEVTEKNNQNNHNSETKF